MLKRGLIGAGGTLGGGSNLFGPRGVFAGGRSGNSQSNAIEYITIATTGNATDFGNLSQARTLVSGTGNGSRGVFGGGFTTVTVSTIDYITIANNDNATYFGELSVVRRKAAATSDGSRGVFGGGYTFSSTTTVFNHIDYITIATTGNAITFGDLSTVRLGSAAVSDGTKGVFGGGMTTNAFSSTVNIIEYITIATTGNAIDFGDLTNRRTNISAASDGSRGVFTPGTSNTGSNSFTIDYITIATLSNATYFGNGTTRDRATAAATSDGTRGVMGGGVFADMSYFTIAVPSDATYFGDLNAPRGNLAATSGG